MGVRRRRRRRRTLSPATHTLNPTLSFAFAFAFSPARSLAFVGANDERRQASRQVASQRSRKSLARLVCGSLARVG